MFEHNHGIENKYKYFLISSTFVIHECLSCFDYMMNLKNECSLFSLECIFSVIIAEDNSLMTLAPMKLAETFMS